MDSEERSDAASAVRELDVEDSIKHALTDLIIADASIHTSAAESVDQDFFFRFGKSGEAF